ncbi:MAG TPA: hypothetical protein VHJ20_03620 [Polyangia bacterium]|nr:hypothetical protein [Polyangia bacterium]
MPWHAIPLEHTHEPLLQVDPLLQAVPHAPQLFESDSNETQAPAQAVSPVAQDVAHEPMSQTWFDEQLTPHAPQWVTLDRSSTHAPPQDVCPSGHTQTPPLQIWSAAQALPQPPQFSLSLVVALHSDPQSTVPPEHPREGQPLAQDAEPSSNEASVEASGDETSTKALSGAAPSLPV